MDKNLSIPFGKRGEARGPVCVPELWDLPCKELQLGLQEGSPKKVHVKPVGLADPIPPRCWLHPRLLLLAIKPAVNFNGDRLFIC